MMRFVPYNCHIWIHGLVICDPAWWVENEEEIYVWMDEYIEGGSTCQIGMTIQFKSDQDQLLFLLRWE